MAKLYFRYGAMGSSKTANAVMVQYNYRERGQQVLMLKPKIENRDGATVVRSRCGLVAQCRYVEELGGIDLTGIDCIIVDECHFMNAAQVRQLVDIVDEREIPACGRIFAASCLKAAASCCAGRIPSRRSRPSAGAAERRRSTRACRTGTSSARASRL